MLVEDIQGLVAVLLLVTSGPIRPGCAMDLKSGSNGIGVVGREGCTRGGGWQRENGNLGGGENRDIWAGGRGVCKRGVDVAVCCWGYCLGDGKRGRNQGSECKDEAKHHDIELELEGRATRTLKRREGPSVAHRGDESLYIWVVWRTWNCRGG